MQTTPIPHSISLEEAIQLTTRFQSDRPADMAICETFEKASVLKMLQVEGAEKFRIYYGKKENGEICAVLVAADAEGNDILPDATSSSKTTDEEDEALILDESFRCPYACPPESPLNVH
jgi:hypothetical protein